MRVVVIRLRQQQFFQSSSRVTSPGDRHRPQQVVAIPDRFKECLQSSRTSAATRSGQVQSDPEGFSSKTDDEDEQFFHRFCWDRNKKLDRELIPRVRLKTPYRTPPLLTISRMLEELENETKKQKNMDAVPRPRARSASASRPKLRQFVPNENVPSAKRFNRVGGGGGPGNRCTSRYEIYNSTTRPFGKSYREMMTSSSADATKTNRDACNESSSAYATCCSDVETLKITGFQCVDENAARHEVTLQTTAVPATAGDDVTEARNYDVDADVDADADADAESTESTAEEKFKSTEIVKRVNEKRLMYNMPASSTWKTYQEEQLTYEPGDERVRKQVVTRSRSLFDLQEEPVDTTTSRRLGDDDDDDDDDDESPGLLSKAASERRSFEDGTRAKIPVVVVRAMPSEKKYSSVASLTLGKDESNTVKYKSQSDLCAAAAEEPRKLDRPKSMDFIGVPRANKSHAETLKRHFYYHPLKPNKKLNDNELPDPDKVLSTRQLFQKELKIPLPPSMNDQNPKTGPRPTQEVRVVPDAYKQQQQQQPKPKKRVSVDCTVHNNNRWTDSGSVSSGVGSEASFDTTESSWDTNNCCGRADGYSSDDDDDEDYLTDNNNKTTAEIVGRPVSADILNKIRKFGTSVTYYGGKVISSSRGVVCSPMTMTIMDEIRHHQKEENVKVTLVKSNSCGSRIELVEEPSSSCGRNNETTKPVEAIREEDEDEERRADGGGGGATSPPSTASESSSSLSSPKLSSASSEETSWKALIVIRKKMNNVVPVYDMEFEEFEVLEEKH